MKYSELVNTTVRSMDNVTLEMLKKALIGEYLSFTFIPSEKVTKDEFAEKICDYFEKIELKKDRSFDKHIDAYIKAIDSIVGNKIAKTPQPKKNDTTPVFVPRARNYYEKALSIKSSRNISPRNLIDYSRLMFCLYTAIVRNSHEEISEFNYSSNCLKPDFIIESMKNEQDVLVGKVTRKHFDIRELYSSDTCSFIIAIIILYTIMNEKIQGEYYHE